MGVGVGVGDSGRRGRFPGFGGGWCGEGALGRPAAGLLVWQPGTLTKTRLRSLCAPALEGQRGQCEGLCQASPGRGSEAARGRERAVGERAGST